MPRLLSSDFAVCSLLLCAVNAFVCPARADAQSVALPVKLECVEAAERAQRVSAQGLLLEARVALRACAREICPSAVRTDCQRWLADVENRIPSLIVRAESDSGEDVGGHQLTIDGAAVAGWLGGREIEVDPGEHAIIVTSPDGRVASDHVVVPVGEKARPVSLRLPNPPRPVQPMDFAPAPAVESRSRIRPFALATAGFAAAALGSFAFFGATGTSDLNQLKRTCAGRCALSDINSAWDKLVVADISLGVGVAATGLALWLFVESPGSTSNASSFGTRLDFVVNQSAAGVNWKTRF